LERPLCLDAELISSPNPPSIGYLSYDTRNADLLFQLVSSPRLTSSA
jgi:hypothetical protein